MREHDTSSYVVSKAHVDVCSGQVAASHNRWCASPSKAAVVGSPRPLFRASRRKIRIVVNEEGQPTRAIMPVWPRSAVRGSSLWPAFPMKKA